MDILRKIFGLTPAPKETVPTATKSSTVEKELVNLEGPTAPLATKKAAENGKAQPLAVLEEEDPSKTNILEDTGSTRKLNDNFESSGRSGQRMIYGIKSDVGQARSNNQDAVLTYLTTSEMSEDPPDFGLFIVADGMGGHSNGEQASATAARTVGHYGYSEIFLPMLRQEEASADRPTITEVLREAIQSANVAVSKAVPEGGTTVTAAAIVGDLAYIGHVGDSRAYLITEEGIEQLTRDHSLVQRLIELEQLTPEEALEHPQRNVLYRAIGQNENVDVDAITRRLPPSSRLLICSDGLWNLVPDEEIRQTVASSPNPQMACEALVKLANARGGSDNISVIIVKMPD